MHFALIHRYCIYVTGSTPSCLFGILLCGREGGELNVSEHSDTELDCPSPAFCKSIRHFQCQTENLTYVLTALGEQCLLIPALY